jgi:sugar/nucleoside kinase (ribokinase family)
MKAARQRGVETIINPAPAIALPDEAYQGLGHLIVNETEAAILSGLENPQDWNEVAAIFIARGVKNVIITLGGEVSPQALKQRRISLINIGCVLQDRKATGGLGGRPHCASKKGRGG